MATVLGLLERIGSDPALRHADDASLRQFLAPLDLDPAIAAALIARDQPELVRLLGARSNVICGLFPAEDAPQEEGDVEPQQEEGDTPTRETEGRALRAAFGR